MATTAKDAFLDLLHDAGVGAVFGNPGTTEFPLIDALGNQSRLRYYLALHDTVAVGMAHGYALATHGPAVVNLHAGPGVANAMGNLYNASRSGVPLLVTAGQIDTRLQLHEPPLWADMVTMMRPVSKWAHEVRSGEELVPAAWRALEVALTPPQGPVFLALPYNVLDEPAGGPVPAFVRPGVARAPDPGDVDRAASVIAAARRPVMVVGDGLTGEDGARAAVELAELTGSKLLSERIPPTAPVPMDHPLHFGTVGASGDAIADALGEADVLVVAGARRLVPVVHHDAWRLPEGTSVVQFEQDPWELGKVFPYEVGVIGDVAGSLRAVADAVGAAAPEAREAARRRRESLERENRRIRAERDSEADEQADRSPIAVSRVVRALREALPSHAVIVDESLTSTRALLRHYPLRPEGFYGIKGTGLGWGLPAALGHQLGDADRPVVAFMGDGATLYSLQALWSAAHYGASLTTVVVNNRSYKILKEGLRAYRGGGDGHYLGTDLSEPAIDYVALAGSFGVPARRVERPEELDEAVKWAIGPGPTVLEVLVDDRF